MHIYSLCMLMKIFLVSIFPEIFESFLQTSLIAKAQEKGILEFEIINPRNFCTDKHQQIDDEIYGGGKWMLLKAQPLIDTINHIVEQNQLQKSDFSILFPSPSQQIFNQKIAYGQSKKDALIFVCGRYEGIDARFEKYCMEHYPDQFKKLSLGQFILLGGELPSCVMIEAITRLIPWVIKEKQSRIDESYAIKDGMATLEAPNYTRPEEVYGMKVPEVLLTWDLEAIAQRKLDNMTHL